jgi:hypothetical protein
VNAGDFLIRDRMTRLIARHRPDLLVELGAAWLPLSAASREGPEAHRAIAICGGPGYQRGMYPHVYPLDALERLTAPVFLMALGSYSLGDPSGEPDALDQESLRFLRWVQSSGGRLGARDVLTARMLGQLGFPDVLMTGDPAWYDLERLDDVTFREASKTVAFTPPANPLFYRQGLRLLDRLVLESGADSLIIVNHRGAQPGFQQRADQLGIRTRDISGSASGFELYDDVGAHVG